MKVKPHIKCLRLAHINNQLVWRCATNKTDGAIAYTPSLAYKSWLKYRERDYPLK